MAKKRRTKKQKEKARERFTYSWAEGTKKLSKKGSVKGQINLGSKSKKPDSKGSEKAYSSALDQSSLNLKKEMIKSVSLAFIIISLELVIYLSSR